MPQTGIRPLPAGSPVAGTHLWRRK